MHARTIQTHRVDVIEILVQFVEKLHDLDELVHLYVCAHVCCVCICMRVCSDALCAVVHVHTVCG